MRRQRSVGAGLASRRTGARHLVRRPSSSAGVRAMGEGHKAVAYLLKGFETVLFVRAGGRLMWAGGGGPHGACGGGARGPPVVPPSAGGGSSGAGVAGPQHGSGSDGSSAALLPGALPARSGEGGASSPALRSPLLRLLLLRHRGARLLRRYRNKGNPDRSERKHRAQVTLAKHTALPNMVYEEPPDRSFTRSRTGAPANCFFPLYPQSARCNTVRREMQENIIQ